MSTRIGKARTLVDVDVAVLRELGGGSWPGRAPIGDRCIVLALIGAAEFAKGHDHLRRRLHRAGKEFLLACTRFERMAFDDADACKYTAISGVMHSTGS